VEYDRSLKHPCAQFSADANFQRWSRFYALSDGLSLAMPTIFVESRAADYTHTLTTPPSSTGHLTNAYYHPRRALALLQVSQLRDDPPCVDNGRRLRRGPLLIDSVARRPVPVYTLCVACTVQLHAPVLRERLLQDEELRRAHHLHVLPAQDLLRALRPDERVPRARVPRLQKVLERVRRAVRRAQQLDLHRPRAHGALGEREHVRAELVRAPVRGRDDEHPE
jgi:hypothetical protein